MNLLIPLKKVREALSELISRVAYGEDTVIITKNGKPVAALIDYDVFEKSKNTKKSYKSADPDTKSVVMDKLPSSVADYTDEEIEKVVRETINEVRRTKRLKALERIINSAPGFPDIKDSVAYVRKLRKEDDERDKRLGI